MRRTIALVLACLLCAAAARAADEDESCLECHAKKAELAKALGDKERALEPLLVDPAKWAKDHHNAKGCANCHFDYDSTPHSEDAETIQCAECHEDAAKVYKESVHANAEKPVHCGECHGLHNIIPPSERDSPLYPLNVHETCGKCHFGDGNGHTRGTELPRERYMADAHGHGILVSGLVVTATCVSCHGHHTIRRNDDPKSRVSRLHVDKVCAECHLGAYEEYEQSIHFLKSSDENEHIGATCTDCHHPHEISKADDEFRTQSVQACSKCHDERGGSFRLTYHGKSTSLGFGGRVATCESCHGNHKILPTSNPESLVNPANVVDTCGKCHTGSHKEFTNYLVHADYRDKEQNPTLWWVWAVMTGLLVGTLILGGLHALLWLIRATAAGEWRRPKPSKAVIRYLRRWPPAYVAFHLAMMIIVLTLATTGLPIHFADMGWAQSFMGIFGGPAATGYVHRLAAVGLGVLFVCYMVHLGGRIAKGEKGLWSGSDTMLPRWKDVQDLWGNVRWFLFLAPRPKYDRWTYWEKFDFWAAFWGLFVIGMTGLMLWFPVETTRFLPGWTLNAAVIIHGIEALLDIAFIFSVHVFHANLRPDKFPMDTMFLSGVVSEQEFKHERPAEYERAVREGKLEELLAAPPSRRRRITAYVIGTMALAVGFFFVAMMIVAVAQKWAG
jgi:cytochrome b subunit of formate dehydrogenase